MKPNILSGLRALMEAASADGSGRPNALWATSGPGSVAPPLPAGCVSVYGVLRDNGTHDDLHPAGPLSATPSPAWALLGVAGSGQH